MSNNKQTIDSYLRRQRFRKVLVFVSVTVLFVGFMSFALYKVYGPDAEIVNYFEVENK